MKNVLKTITSEHTPKRTKLLNRYEIIKLRKSGLPTSEDGKKFNFVSYSYPDTS